MIPPKTIDEIRAVAKIDEVIGDYVNLKKRGVNLLGLCPFHNEKTPSFTVSPAKNLYKCFGCGRGGDTINFLMEHDHFTYPEALTFLAQRYNIKIEEVEKDDEQLKAEQTKQSLLLINEYAQKYFHEQLLSSEEGRAIGLSYFKHRGLIESTIHTFSLGYSHKNPHSFTAEAEKKGYNLDSLKSLGLVSQSGSDFFRERVIFPFHNISGKVIGFGGRILNDNPRAPKYLNSPESNLYNKRKTLYGLYQAKTEIRRHNECYLVEGYTDVLSLHQNGIKNVVASSGTSLTNEQVSLIKRFADQVLVLYDGDQAGQNAAVKGLDIFLENNLDVRLVVLPENADPDSYIREVGATAFGEFVKENTKDFILLLANNIQKETANDPINKSIQVRDLVVSIAKISDQIKRAIYVKQVAAILDLPEQSLIKEVNKAIGENINKRKKENFRNRESDSSTESEHHNRYIKEDHSQGIGIKIDTEEYQERDIVRVLLSSGAALYDAEEGTTIAEYVLSNLGEFAQSFRNEYYQEIVLEFLDNLLKGQILGPDHFTSHINSHVKKIAIDLLTDRYSYANWSDKGVELQTQKPIGENFIKDSYQAVMRYKLLKIKERIHQLKEVLEDQDAEKSDALILAYQKLIAERQTLAGQLNTVIV